MTPHAKDLFIGAIAISGTVLNPWGIQEDPLPHAKRLAQELGCPTDDTKTMIAAIKSKTSEEIFGAFAKVALFPTLFPLHFTPVVDSSSSKRFFPDTPINLLRQGEFHRVPLVIGLTENEGEGFVDWWNISAPIDRSVIETGLEKMIMDISDLRTNLPEVANRVRQEYFEGVDLDNPEALRGALSEVFSDSLYNAGVTQFIELYAEQNVPVHMFLLTYVQKHKGFAIVGERERKYSNHGDDIGLLFEISNPHFPKLGDDAKKASQNMIHLFTDFTKHNSAVRANYRWAPLQPGEGRYLRIDSELRMGQYFRQDKAQLWTEILPKISAGEELRRDEL
jgi:carboxylesterase type B